MKTYRQNHAVTLASLRIRRRIGLLHPVGVLRHFSVLLALMTFMSFAHGEEMTSGKTAPSVLPPFLFQPMYASNQGSVYGVMEARHADLVLLNGGFDSGFQPGMLCLVGDDEGEVGEIILVDVRNNCSAALILDLESGKVIEPGNSVRIKTVRF